MTWQVLASAGGVLILLVSAVFIFIKWGEKRGQEKLNTATAKASLETARKILKKYEDTDKEYDRIVRELGLDTDPCLRKEGCKN